MSTVPGREKNGDLFFPKTQTAVAQPLSFTIDSPYLVERPIPAGLRRQLLFLFRKRFKIALFPTSSNDFA